MRMPDWLYVRLLRIARTEMQRRRRVRLAALDEYNARVEAQRWQ